MRFSYSVVLAAMFVAGSAAAHADTVFYPNFNTTAGLTLVGSTTATGGQLQLTPAAGGQAGAAYSTTAITLGAGNSFSTQFQFQFTNPGGIDPADGITFVLAASSTGLGSSGGGIGYGGVNHSVAIEFDSFDNGTGAGDPNDNHVGLDINGNLASVVTGDPYGAGDNTGTACGPGIPGCFSNGDVWTSTITYDGTSLNVTVQDGSMGPQIVIASFPITIGDDLGTNTAFVGFTAGTGSGFENQDILNWEFSNTAVLPPTGAVPEPTSLSLLGTGLLGVVGVARRRFARQ